VVWVARARKNGGRERIVVARTVQAALLHVPRRVSADCVFGGVRLISCGSTSMLGEKSAQARKVQVGVPGGLVLLDDVGCRSYVRRFRVGGENGCP